MTLVYRMWIIVHVPTESSWQYYPALIMVVTNDIMAGKVPGDTLNKMESCKFLIVILFWILSVTEGNQSSTSILC